MKAVRIVEPYKVEMFDLPKPEAGAEDVLIEVKALGLCGSDLTTYRGLNSMVSYPRVPGHEIAGQIVGVGSDVPSKFVKGQLVTVSPYTACGDCPSCKTGRVNCCKFNQTMGVQRDGAATEYISLPYPKVFVVENVPDERIACIEPLSVGWHATNRANVDSDDTVLVFGCGVIGLGAITAAAFKGATVIAVDIDDDKLAKAKALGAKYNVNSANEDLDKAIQDITSQEGPSVVIEAVGLPVTFAKSVELVSFAGRVVYIGYTKKKVEYDTKLFVSKELDIKGSRNAFNDEIESVIEMLCSGKIDIEPIITQKYELKDCNKALEYWDKNPDKVTKIVLCV